MENKKHKFKSIEVIRVIFALATIFLIWHGWSMKSTDTLLELSPDSLFLLGVYFSALFIISSIEEIFSPINELFLTKIIVTLSVTALIIVCTAEASDILNRVYSTDASLFPFSRSFLTGILFFKKIYPFLFALSIILITWLFLQLIEKSMEKDVDNCTKILNILKYLIYIAPALTYLVYFNKLNESYFDSSLLDKKAYILAYKLDFYENKVCKNDNLNNGKIVYLDPSYKYVLFDKSIINDSQDVWGIIRYGTKQESDMYMHNWTNPDYKPKLSVESCIGIDNTSK